jgi:hypothetical protein
LYSPALAGQSVRLTMSRGRWLYSLHGTVRVRVHAKSIAEKQKGQKTVSVKINATRFRCEKPHKRMACTLAPRPVSTVHRPPLITTERPRRSWTYITVSADFPGYSSKFVRHHAPTATPTRMSFRRRAARRSVVFSSNPVALGWGGYPIGRITGCRLRVAT